LATPIEEYLDNPIKKHIITRLIKNETLKYSQLQPEDTDNVLFNYHLQHLVKLGLLDKTDSTYTLSQIGREMTANITHNGLYFPKFICYYKMYLIDQIQEKVLFQHRRRTPWYNDTTALSSKLVKGEFTDARADLRMKQKTNLDTHMKCVGTLRKFVYNSGHDLLEDSITFICYATEFSGQLENLSENQDPLMWLSFAEAQQKEQENHGSGKVEIEILDRFKRADFSAFFYEEEITAEHI
jgi:hypothetical protein